MAREAPLDAAILDVTIRGGHVYPVAEQLLARDIPFVLASGYADSGTSREPSRSAPPVEAVTAQDVERQVRALCRPGRG